MAALTPDEFEQELLDLRGKVLAYLERGEGKAGDLHRQAERVLALREQFPDVYERHADVEGVVAELLAREKQLQVMGTGAPGESPGCLLGLLAKRRKPR